MQTNGFAAIYRVLYQAQGLRETLCSGGKHCPLWGVRRDMQCNDFGNRSVFLSQIVLLESYICLA